MSMLGVLGGLKPYFKVKQRAEISNLTFDLCKLGTALLVACSMVITAKQYFGEFIHCSINDKLSLKVFESYCFMAGTYTVPHDASSTLHHGVGLAEASREDSSTLHHNFYQWVPLVLVLQAAACYLPWQLWKGCEGGRVSKLLAKVSQDPLTETPVEEQVESLGTFLLTHRGWYNSTALRLLVCQALTLATSIGQLYAMDLLLGGRFLALGGAVTDYSVLRTALATTFPTVTICSMELFGVSGSNKRVSGMCTLPVNIVNEKVYLVLWFWFLLATLVAAVQLVRQLLLLASSLRSLLSPGLSSTLSSPRQVQQLVTRGSYGDTVLLQLVAANTDSSQFAELVRLLVRGQTLEDSRVSQVLGLSRHQDLLDVSVVKPRL